MNLNDLHITKTGSAEFANTHFPLNQIMKRAALIVDDDADIRMGLSLILRKNEVECGFAASAQEALDILKHQHFGLVFTDLKMPEMDGLKLLRAIKKRWPKTIVIVITAFGSIETAVEPMSAGAYHYITKPFFNNEIFITLERGLSTNRN